MSQLFDSLRRGRQAPRGDGAGLRGAQGDAVLATLGHTAGGRRSARPFVVIAAFLLVIAVVAWAGWNALTAPSPQAPPASAHAPARPVVPPAAAAPREAAVVATSPALPEPEPASLALPTPEAAAAPAVARGIRVPSGGRAVPATRGDQQPAQPPAPASKPQPVDHMALALYHHRAGDFEQALVNYRALLQQNEMNAQAHHNLGMLYQEKNLLADAAAAFQRALIINPQYVLAHNNYGVTLLRQGRTDAAAAQFRAALAIEPQNVDAFVNLALAEKAGGHGEQARASLLRALGLAPKHAAAHYNLAVLYDEAGESARAAVHYRAFLDNAGPEHADRAPEVRARLDAIGGR